MRRFLFITSSIKTEAEKGLKIFYLSDRKGVALFKYWRFF